MQAARETVKNRPQLDPEWLLGPTSLGHDPLSSSDACVALANDSSAPIRPHPHASFRSRRSLLLRLGFGLSSIALVVLGAWIPWHRILDVEPLAQALRLPAMQGSESAEDTLRTMLELSAAVTQSNAELVDQLCVSNMDDRTAAFQSLCTRIQSLGTNRAAISQRIALVQLLQTVPAQDQEVSRMRGLLASQLLQGLALNDPAIQSTRQALIAMLDADSHLESEPTASSAPSKLRTPTARVVPVDRSLRIAGVEQLPLRDVLSLTQSQQSKRVDAAISELRRRGFNSRKIETLFELAHGSSTAPSHVEVQVHSVFGDDAPSVLEWLALSKQKLDGPSAMSERSLAASSHAGIAESAWLASGASPATSQWPDRAQNKDPQR